MPQPVSLVSHIGPQIAALDAAYLLEGIQCLFFLIQPGLTSCVECAGSDLTTTWLCEFKRRECGSSAVQHFFAAEPRHGGEPMAAPADKRSYSARFAVGYLFVRLRFSYVQ